MKLLEYFRRIKSNKNTFLKNYDITVFQPKIEHPNGCYWLRPLHTSSWFTGSETRPGNSTRKTPCTVGKSSPPSASVQGPKWCPHRGSSVVSACPFCQWKGPLTKWRPLQHNLITQDLRENPGQRSNSSGMVMAPPLDTPPLLLSTTAVKGSSKPICCSFSPNLG